LIYLWPSSVILVLSPVIVGLVNLGIFFPRFLHVLSLTWPSLILSWILSNFYPCIFFGVAKLGKTKNIFLCLPKGYFVLIKAWLDETEKYLLEIFN